MKAPHLAALLLIGGLTFASRVVAQAPATAPRAATSQAQTAPQRSATADTPAGNAEEGKKLFVSYGCYQCHGYEAQGSSATGPRLGPRPIPLATVLKYVRAPTGQMPPYTAKVVSDADLTNIYAFLQSRTAPPPAGSIELLK